MQSEEQLKSENDQTPTLNLIYDPDLELPLASVGQRFVNYVVDVFFSFLFFLIVLSFFALISTWSESFDQFFNELFEIPFSSSIFFMLSLIVYFIFFEGLFGFTPGKLFTKTEVVDIYGNKLSFGKLFIRSICRFIPFENFSFFSNNAVGWHDLFSKSRVIQVTRTRKLLAPVLIMCYMPFALFLIFGFSQGLHHEIFPSSRNSYKTLKFEYDGISFRYPDNWQTTVNQVENTNFFQITCIKKGISASDNFILIYTYLDLLHDEWLTSTIETIQSEDPVHYNSIFKKPKAITYCNMDALMSEYKGQYLNQKFFGELITFNNGYITGMIFKQAMTYQSLKENFKVIDMTLEIETFEDESEPIVYEDYNQT